MAREENAFDSRSNTPQESEEPRVAERTNIPSILRAESINRSTTLFIVRSSLRVYACSAQFSSFFSGREEEILKEKIRKRTRASDSKAMTVRQAQ